MLLLASCTNNEDKDWEKSLPISEEELHSKQGDCFAFQDSTNKYFLGVVMNFHKSKDGIWYAMCFTNYYDTFPADMKSMDTLKFCGRKVMYYAADNYTIGFDIVWTRDSLIRENSKKLLGNIDITDVQEIDIFAEENAFNFQQFTNAFYRSKDDRQSPPDDYGDLTKEHLRTDEYFTLSQIKDWHRKFLQK